jgi:hypothetical protein
MMKSGKYNQSNPKNSEVGNECKSISQWNQLISLSIIDHYLIECLLRAVSERVYNW